MAIGALTEKMKIARKQSYAVLVAVDFTVDLIKNPKRLLENRSDFQNQIEEESKNIKTK